MSTDNNRDAPMMSHHKFDDMYIPYSEGRHALGGCATPALSQSALLSRFWEPLADAVGRGDVWMDACPRVVVFPASDAPETAALHTARSSGAFAQARRVRGKPLEVAALCPPSWSAGPTASGNRLPWVTMDSTSADEQRLQNAIFVLPRASDARALPGQRRASSDHRLLLAAAIACCLLRELPPSSSSSSMLVDALRCFPAGPSTPSSSSSISPGPVCLGADERRKLARALRAADAAAHAAGGDLAQWWPGSEALETEYADAVLDDVAAMTERLGVGSGAVAVVTSLCTMAICEIDGPTMEELRQMVVHPERGVAPLSLVYNDDYDNDNGNYGVSDSHSEGRARYVEQGDCVVLPIEHRVDARGDYRGSQAQRCVARLPTSDGECVCSVPRVMLYPPSWPIVRIAQPKHRGAFFVPTVARESLR